MKQKRPSSFVLRPSLQPSDPPPFIIHHLRELDKQQCRHHKRRRLSRGKTSPKTFFDLDLSDEPSTASKIPKPRDHNRLIASKPPAIDEAKGNNKAALLTLPVEIRLRIYDLLLVSRFDRTENPSWAVGNRSKVGPARHWSISAI